MLMSNDALGPWAILSLPRQNKPLITFARAVHDHIANNANFPHPLPPLSVLEEDIAAFEDAETKAAAGGKGAAKLRDAKKKKVVKDLGLLRNHVQGVADAQASAAEAAAVIESAFMSVRKPIKRNKPAFEVKNGEVSGTVTLTAKAVAANAVYYWQYSTDNESWASAPETLQASTTLGGLTPARTYYFRFRALTRATEIGFSQVVSLIVH